MAGSTHNPDDFAWAVPVMRAGYAGRGLVYLAVGVTSIWSLLQGGEAEGTQEALRHLKGAGGSVVLILIALGMLAYAVWRVTDAIWDLEAYGAEVKGLAARCGLAISGVIHLGLGGVAVTALMARLQSDGSAQLVTQVMQLPFGRLAVGAVGFAVIGAGGYYVTKGAKASYRQRLRANAVTEKANVILQLGLLAQAAILSVAGGLIVYAAYAYAPEAAGGMDRAFEWMRAHPYGRMICGAVSAGLLGFALFCFVNALYRIVPRATETDVETLARKLKAKAAGD
ncbi:DUF1206 domain-containing protein [Thioclava sp. GXIMD4215]|uniref:DUF1206 domain-containing protein n=1 Tax=Thioclava sp. GXIMD4215 TaxID=3131928 RepID=UPI003251041E